jgi:hypothetical protein
MFNLKLIIWAADLKPNLVKHYDKIALKHCCSRTSDGMNETTLMWTEYLVSCLSLGEACCSMVHVNTSQSSAPLTSSYDSRTSSEQSLTDTFTDSAPLTDSAPIFDSSPLTDSENFQTNFPEFNSQQSLSISKELLLVSGSEESLSVTCSKDSLPVSSSKESLPVSCSKESLSVSPVIFTSLSAVVAPAIMTAGGDTMGLAPTSPPQDIYFFPNSPTLLANLPPSPLFELLDDDMGCGMEDISLEHEFPPPGESIAILHNMEKEDQVEDEIEIQNEDEDDPEYFPEDVAEIEVVSNRQFSVFGSMENSI